MSVDNSCLSFENKEGVIVQTVTSLLQHEVQPPPAGLPTNAITEEQQIESKEDIVPTPGSQPSDCGDGPSPEANERAWRQRGWIHFLTLCWVFILEGWNDSSLGPLLPAIQEFYGVTYTVVSLIFFFLCVGYLLGAIANVYIVHRLDFGKTIVLGTIGQVVAYAVIIPAPPFPVIVFAYTLYGFTTMMQNTQVNAFVAGLNDSSKMGILHCVYGTGAFISPFVSTMFATTRLWHLYYFTALGLAVSVTASLMIVFKLKTRKELYATSGVTMQDNPNAHSEHNIYHQLCGIRALYLLSLFAFAYIGLELTIGGWTVTYLIHRTGAGSSAGFVSSGFFAGLALGRVLLLWVNKKVGPRRVIFLYALLAIVLEALIWAVPHFIASAVLVSFVGLLLGPMFPILMNQCGNFFPPHLLSGGIGSVVGVGALGGSLVPFITGVLADRFGVTSWPPLMVAMMGFLMVVWAGAIYDSRGRNQARSTTSPA